MANDHDVIDEWLGMGIFSFRFNDRQLVYNMQHNYNHNNKLQFDGGTTIAMYNKND